MERGKKICTKCQKKKKLEEFHFINKKTGRKHPRCKKCIKILDHERYIKNSHKIKIQKQRYRENFPHTIKNIKLEYYYGITIKQFNSLLKKQNSKCAICDKKETSRNRENGTVRSLAVDHDHNSNKVRGLLCGQCNRDLGIYEKCKMNPSFNKYLEKFNAS